MDSLLRIEKRYAVGLFGLLIAIPSLYVAFDEKRPRVTYDIISETNVLDVNAPVRDLVISYRGENIAERSLNLRILMLRVENTGEVDITQNLYDTNDVFGVQVASGRIVESPRVVGANSRYVASNLKPVVRGSNTIAFNKIIFDRGEYAILEVRILHARASNPTLLPLGKIAGVDEIRVVSSFIRNRNPSHLARAFSGGLSIHLIRLVVYPIATLVLILLSLVPIILVTDLLNERRRKRRRKEFVPLVRRVTDDPELREYFTRVYEIGGPELIRSTKELLDNRQKRRSMLQQRAAIRRLQKSDPMVARHHRMRTGAEFRAIMLLVKGSHAERSRDGDLTLSPAASTAFKQLEEALLARGSLSKSDLSLVQPPSDGASGERTAAKES